MAEDEKRSYVLPQPIVQEHYYLHAIVIELQGIRAALEAQMQGGQEVELKEPKAKPKRGDA